ncbi:hypothetical protein Ddye_031749 [Dipteronia dyeriana]|uniref:RNase H type-1 domain-containing protein n=1 Tax=Dipteronia dyeriana TaxID=168575 RepID=A0AAD9TJJ8_9ROSI|nr:hypothetical protein Ddye_031749 [Dipteronia dyeriana]
MSWLVWRNRNLKVHSRKGLPCDEIWNMAGNYLYDLESCDADRFPCPPRSSRLRWNPPPKSEFKLNVDAAVNIKNGFIGLGAVIRDDRGVVRDAAAFSTTGSMDVEIVEARAILEGLRMAACMVFFPLLVESNVLNVVKMCNGDFFSRYEADNVVHDSCNVTSFIFLTQKL